MKKLSNENLINFDLFKKMKKELDDMKTEKDKTQGALEQLTKRLKEDHNCSSVEKAEKIIKDLEDDLETAKTEYEKSFESFEKKFSSKLEEN